MTSYHELVGPRNLLLRVDDGGPDARHVRVDDTGILAAVLDVLLVLFLLLLLLVVALDLLRVGDAGENGIIGIGQDVLGVLLKLRGYTLIDAQAPGGLIEGVVVGQERVVPLLHRLGRRRRRRRRRLDPEADSFFSFSDPGLAESGRHGFLPLENIK